MTLGPICERVMTLGPICERVMMLRSITGIWFQAAKARRPFFFIL